MRGLTADRRGISPILGGVLMVVIVVALAAVVATMTLGFGGALEEPAPMVASGESIDVTLEGNDTAHALEFVHRGGESVPAGALTATVGSGDAAQRIPVDESTSGALADGRWSSGERLRLDLEASSICAGGGDTADVRLTYEDPRGDHSATVSERTVPVERGQFVVNGDSIEATTKYTANVKFLGTGWSSRTEHRFYDYSVRVSVQVDDEEQKSWESGDSDNTVGAYGVSSQEAGTPLSIVAEGEYPGEGWRTTSESKNDEYLVVLRDGDPVPNFDAGGGQQDVAAYADSFIEDGEISLDDNQAVFLFDFNHDTPPDEVDYQDAVVLVSFFTRENEGTQVHADGSGENVVVCPSETRSASPNGGGNGNGNGNGDNGNGN